MGYRILGPTPKTLGSRANGHGTEVKGQDALKYRVLMRGGRIVTAEVYLSDREQLKLIRGMTQAEVEEVLHEAAFHRMSTEQWLRSAWAQNLRTRVREREEEASSI